MQENSIKEATQSKTERKSGPLEAALKAASIVLGLHVYHDLALVRGTTTARMILGSRRQGVTTNVT